MPALPSTLHKEERIYSKKLIDALFQGVRSRSLSAFPLRVVYMSMETEDSYFESDKSDNLPNSCFLVSVPKRCFKRAVKRNRVKRQVREVYRKNKSIIADHRVALAFIWLDGELRTSEVVETKVVNLLRRVNERLSSKE